MMRHYHCLLAVLLATISISADATTYRVGPARPSTSLQQVAGLLQAGDTVLVDGDVTYSGGVSFSRPGLPAQPILIRGVRVNDRRPVIDGGTNGVAFITSSSAADHYIFEGFEVRNATFRGLYHQAGDLTLRDLVVHNCNNGLMGADNGSGSLLLEYCEFYQNGAGTSAHQIYMATDEITHPGSVFRMQFCWIHDGTGGNNVKSRAERNEIYYNWIEGAVYHELELIGPDPAGEVPAELKREDSDVVGNVLRKRATSYGSTGTFYVTRFGGDATGESKGRYRVVNNTVLMGTSAAFRLFDGLESVEMHNNVFCSVTGAAAPIIRTVEAEWTSGEQISGQNNWVQSVLTTIPSGWTGTLTGSDPGFVDRAGGDFTLAAGSTLINAGTSTPQPPAGYPFTSPLFPPGFHPPQGILLSPGSAVQRTIVAAPDIGAFESQHPTSILSDTSPITYRLEQNFPNPFNASTTIRYSLPEAGAVELAVFDILGRRIAELVRQVQTAGEHSVKVDLPGLSSSVYLYRLSAGGFVRTRSMVIQR
ncbi:MAG: T9SS type A sorting domain-containing protein [Bacteroidetes bacterium]|nr:T9SS type A sorting domain-containing protein [Bacteroidota bacterium]